MVALKIDFCFLLRWYVTARIDLCLVGFKHGVFATAFSVRAAFNWTLDWTRYFQQEKVFHIKCQLEDTTLTPPHLFYRWDERIPDLVASCLEQWKIVCGQLWKQSMLAVTRGESMHVLFHCFGGINRSAGALCAWLVVGYNYSAEDAVQLLLEKRPSLRPWHNRPYVLEALWKLEGLRTEWHMELSAADGN
jgi:protein-tyrosine phosphatase